MTETGLTKRVRACLALVAGEPHGVIDVYDPRLEVFCDDNTHIRFDDTINRCFTAKLLVQRYNGCTDTGTVEVTPAGRSALSRAREGEDAR
jgi:hypothetical protein